jgi:hypothetical protein
MPVFNLSSCLRRAVQPVAFASAVLASLAFSGVSLAAYLEDVQGTNYTYGGVTCAFGGISHLNNSGGSAGYSFTGIITSSCFNGYRELYTQAKKTNNAVVSYYSGWVLSDTTWTFPGAGDLCEILGKHRMSRTGVDTSPYVYTLAWSCIPA